MLAAAAGSRVRSGRGEGVAVHAGRPQPRVRAGAQQHGRLPAPHLGRLAASRPHSHTVR